MQFCQQHWDSMREAVRLRGMEHLVARSGEEAVADLTAQLEGTATQQNWDPLMAAHWAILTRVMRSMGLAALGDFCPLCEVQSSYDWAVKNMNPLPAEARSAQQWVDSCMDSMLEYARENKWVPGKQ